MICVLFVFKWFEISFGTAADGDHEKTVGSAPEPNKLDPDNPEKKTEGADPKTVAKVGPVQKNKWPAFVPGNPIFPEPTKKEDEIKAKPDTDASSNLNKLKGALTNPDTKGSPKDKAEESKKDDVKKKEWKHHEEKSTDQHHCMEKL